ncbi:MAG: alpha-2-macroglobulin family protein [bacterium]
MNRYDPASELETPRQATPATPQEGNLIGEQSDARFPIKSGMTNNTTPKAPFSKGGWGNPEQPANDARFPIKSGMTNNASQKAPFSKGGWGNLEQPTQPPKKPTLWANFTHWIKHHKWLFGLTTFISVLLIIGSIFGLVTGFNFLGFTQKIAQNVQSFIASTSISARAQDFSITPDKKDSLGVLPESSFILKSKGDVTINQIQKNLSISPTTKIKVDQTSINEFKINPESPLGQDQIYKLILKIDDKDNQNQTKDLSWGFQIQNPFRIVATTPRNKATKVPLNSGIEIAFSADSFTKIEDSFEIAPKVKGSFQKTKSIASFIPEKLEPRTLYTVKIKKGLTLENSKEILKDDYIFQFETQDKESRDFSIGFTRSTYEFKTDEKPALSVFVAPSSVVKAEVNLYKFKDLAQFLNYLQQNSNRPGWATFSKFSENFDLTQLSKTLGQELPIQNTNGNLYIELPKILDKGYYLAQVVSGDFTDSAPIQIIDTAAYFSQSESKTLVWAVDLANKKALSAATIKTLEGKNITSTNDQGTAFFETPSEFKNDRVNFYQIISNDNTLIIPNSGEFDPQINGGLRGNLNSSSDNYWNYLYFDRPLYHKTDTLNFWGVVKNRGAGQEGIQAVLYQTGGLSTPSESPLKVDSKNIAISSQGTFFDSFKLQNLPAGSYSINILNSQNLIISTKTFIVQDFVKPVYEISLTTDKQAYFGGENITFSGKVTFYDGTPVSNLNLVYDSNSRGEVTTNSNGEFKITLKTIKDTYVTQTNSFYGGGGYISIWPKNEEESDNTYTKYFPVINSQIGVSNDQNIQDSKAVVDLTLSKLTLDKINQNTSTTTGDLNAGPVAGKDVQAQLTAYTYDKVKVGQYYNFITKKTEDSFEYRQKVLKTTPLNLKTNDQGIARLEFSTIASKELVDEIKLTSPEITIGTGLDFTINFNFQDLDSQPLQYTQWIYQATKDSFAGNNYTIDDATGTTNYEKNYKVDEPISLKLNSPSKTTQANSQYLFYYAQRGISEFVLQDRSDIKFNFKDTFVPNVYVYGVRFDGRNFFLSFPRILNFDSGQKLLNISVKSDKPTYKPKDEVKLEFEVTGIDNKPRSGELNVSVVDESLFSLSADYSDILPELYRNVSSGVSGIYNSHQNPGLGLQVGGLGGGGGGSKRSNFLDTVAFQTIQTDTNGKAKFSFKLPDNLTKWRITTQAFTSNLEAGKQITNITSTQDFFVNPSINSSFLTGDKPVLKLRTFGAKLNDNNNVAYKVESESLNLEPFNVNAIATVGQDITLPALTTGQQKIKVTAVSGENSDTVEKSFSVKDSQQTQRTTKNYELTDKTKIETNSSSSSYEAIFSSGQKAKYLENLQKLASQNGDRLDQKLATSLSQNLLSKEFGQNISPDKVEYQNYQGPKNGLTMLPYGDDDLSLTVLALAANKDQLPGETIKSYLYKIVNSQTEGLDRTSIALYGLSLLGEKVLNQAQILLNKSDTTSTDRIYLALAAVENGDLESARSVYTDLVKNRLSDNQNYKFVNISQNDDDNLKATGLMSILGQNLEESSANKFFDYIVSHTSERILTSLEQVIFLQKLIPSLANIDAEFSYILNGQTQTQKISKDSNFALLLNADQAKNITFKTTNTKVNLTVVSTIPLSQLVSNSEDFQVDRKYYVNAAETTSFKSSDVVTVELNYKIPNTKNTGCVQVTDYLPSGLRAINPQSFGQTYSNDTKLWYPYSIDNNKISFCINSNNKGPIKYLARVTSKGEFKAEATIIQNLEATSQINFGKPVIVIIN